MRLLLLAGCVCLMALVTTATKPVLAHGGGLDFRGCHNDRKNGGYHCHQGTCAGRSFGSASDAIAAGCKR